MKLETYRKNKKLFEENYKEISPKYLPLNIPIDLCMKGIHGKQNFFTYYSYDKRVNGNNVVWSCNDFNIYYRWDYRSMSKISTPREIGMFDKWEENFYKFDEYIKSREKTK